MAKTYRPNLEQRKINHIIARITAIINTVYGIPITSPLAICVAVSGNAETG